MNTDKIFVIAEIAQAHEGSLGIAHSYIDALKDTGIDAIKWIKEVEELGAGEILLTSMDRDGTKDGYDNYLNKAVTDKIKIPLIASGGCGTLEHIYDAFKDGNASAALAASIFHYKEYTCGDVKEYLKKRNILIRA